MKAAKKIDLSNEKFQNIIKAKDKLLAQNQQQIKFIGEMYKDLEKKVKSRNKINKKQKLEISSQKKTILKLNKKCKECSF